MLVSVKELVLVLLAAVAESAVVFDSSEVFARLVAILASGSLPIVVVKPVRQEKVFDIIGW